MFELVVKVFDSGLKLFGLGVKMSLEQVDWIFFVVYTDEEKVDFRKEKAMTAFMRVRTETQPDCTRVTETLAVYIGVAEIPPICTLVAETYPDRIIIAGTPPLLQKKKMV